jgi:hypothetical protein
MRREKVNLVDRHERTGAIGPSEPRRVPERMPPSPASAVRVRDRRDRGSGPGDAREPGTRRAPVRGRRACWHPCGRARTAPRSSGTRPLGSMTICWMRPRVCSRSRRRGPGLAGARGALNQEAAVEQLGKVCPYWPAVIVSYAKLDVIRPERDDRRRCLRRRNHAALRSGGRVLLDQSVQLRAVHGQNGMSSSIAPPVGARSDCRDVVVP